MESFNETEVTEFIFLAFTNSSRYPVLVFTTILFLYVTIILGNILMLLVIGNDSRLHTPMYVFVSMFSCSDMCYMTSIIPQTLRSLLAKNPVISYYRCATQMFFCNLFGEVQLLLITIMTYDRYIAISDPLRYKIRISHETCFTFLGLALLFSATVAVVLVYLLFRLPFCRIPQIEHFYCDLGQVLPLTCPNHKYFISTVITAYYLGVALVSIPFITLIMNYGYIVSVILKIRTSEGRRKAFSTFSYSIPLVVVEYSCIFFMYFRIGEAFYLDKDKVFVMVFTLIAPIVNPVVYTVRNKAVYDGVKKLFSVNVI